ncbi:guanylate kinase [Proteiniclasticum sp. BAD-10]|uniref:Guanylate kinase n=1 Tax=Proteiniclasticum sediminis TaxID=2804028 RepID=A0A941CSM2_9CLOT|nr:guanylate kinase [Proteiniclasticum sediminis]MBR0576844.1 guanylate kinase [Proteiniclasticum sediminis]
MIYIITGPSGAGKTLVGEYLKSKGLRELVSHTTRAPRPGEKDGEAYHFVDRETFQSTPKVEESEYAGNLYGVSRAEVDAKLCLGDVVAVTDFRGARSFKKHFGDEVRVIFVDSSVKNLRQRMKKRGDSPENIRRRILHRRNSRETGHRLFADYIVDNNSSIRTLYRKVDQLLRRR